MDADRTQVMAYRMVAQQLQRVDDRPQDLAVLALGVQDTPYGAARQALAARTTADIATDGGNGSASQGGPGAGSASQGGPGAGSASQGGPGAGSASQSGPGAGSASQSGPGAGSASQSRGDLRLAWTHRGAPHLHRAADLVGLMPALWPFSDADAASRLKAGPIREGAKLGLAAFDQTARAFRAAVTEPMPKGDVSTAVSARVDRSLTYDCRSCGARHISGGLFQSAGLAGGVGIRVRGAQTVIEPLADRGRVPTAAAGVEAVIRTYLRLLGPATLGEVAKFIGTTQTHLRPFWPRDLAEIAVEGRKTYLPVDAVDVFRSAGTMRAVRLLPPSDPLLQARDRDLLVPDKAHQAEVWRILGNPGALLVDGEIVGTWRAKAAGKRELAVTVTPFGTLPRKVRTAVEAEAAVVAGVRALPAVTVRFE